MHASWRDCRLTVDGAQVLLENAALQTGWQMSGDGLALSWVENRSTGFRWQAEDGAPASAACMALPAGAQPQWEARPHAEGLCAAHWVVSCTWKRDTVRVSRYFLLYPECPFLTLWTEWESPPAEAFTGQKRPLSAAAGIATGIEADARETASHCVPGDVMAVVPLPGGHLQWQCVRFSDQTDTHDTLVWTQRAPVYRTESVEADGSIFTIEDVLSGEALFAARHAPVTPAPGPHFRLTAGCLSILQNGCAGTLPESAAGCSCVLGVGQTQHLWEQYRRFYRLGWQAPWQKHAVLLSNTWGDRSRDARVCEAFLLREIDRAAALGLDAVQIDDGWQTGTTVNSAQPAGGVWEGYYAARADFWAPHPARFPQGLLPVAEYAAARGIALGLWFSPDSSGDFIHWQQDADTLLQLWQTYGIAVFKLDGVKLRTPTARSRYLSLLEAVCARSSGQIQLQQDITAEQRLGYFSAREYGTLFVENRYTDFGNYYPHRTLRNLWMLSRYIPAQRMLFELLNPRRNAARYAGDPFAPGLYTADHLFAVTMPAQPLFWMELSGLSDSDAACLQRIVSVYREHRDALWQCDVCPVGQEPDGRSFTGFVWTAPGAQAGYLLLFRENTPECEAAFPEIPHPARLDLLYTNTAVDHTHAADGTVYISFAQPRSYAFYRWEVPSE